MMVCFLLKSCLWFGVARQSKSCLSEGLIECEFVLLWGAGSLVSPSVDLNRWARGSDYITYKRTGLSDIWGSPKSGEESWLFSWSHHRWKGLSFYPCPSFFPSVPYVGATVAVGQEEVEISSKQTGWRPRQEVVASWCGHCHLESLSFAGPESLFCQGIWTDQILWD